MIDPFTTPPLSGESVYFRDRIPVHVGIDTIYEMIADYSDLTEEFSGLYRGIKDMRVKSTVMGLGTYTTNHMDDSDYLVYFEVMYQDRDWWNECTYGVHNGKISLWEN